jgi:uncharacterized protein (TIGR03435 family)
MAAVPSTTGARLGEIRLAVTSAVTPFIGHNELHPPGRPLLSNDSAKCSGLRTTAVKYKLKVMRASLFLSVLTLLSAAAAGQAPKTLAFEIASVKPSQRQIGADYNNQFTVSPSGITARNATLRRVVSEAYRLQVHQVLGPSWLDQNEYDIEARTGDPVDREKLDRMLRTLLAERFNLKQHGETREMRAYELLTDKAGPKIQPMRSGETAKTGAGFHFHGDMRQFADFLAVQLSIPILDDPNQPGRAGGPTTPVLDKTGLTGVYDFTADVRPELGTDSFSRWRIALREQLGLRIESSRGQVEVLVVDDAARIPTGN